MTRRHQTTLCQNPEDQNMVGLLRATGLMFSDGGNYFNYRKLMSLHSGRVVHDRCSSLQALTQRWRHHDSITRSPEVIQKWSDLYYRILVGRGEMPDGFTACRNMADGIANFNKRTGTLKTKYRLYEQRQTGYDDTF
jgi:hypothetical protein